jgi:hypothetical protein
MQPKQQWQGPERRQPQGRYIGEERRHSRQAGYPTDAGVNAEQPSDAQEERELQQERGPNPRIPK